MNEVYRINKSTLDDIGSALREANNTTEKFAVSSIGDKIRELASGGGENKLAKVVDRSITEITEADLQGVTSIGAFAFSTCIYLERVALPDSITHIDTYVFRDCKALIDIVVPNSVPKISDRTFSGCEKLKSAKIGNVTSIGNYAFADCKSLERIKIQATTPPTIQAYTFQNVPSSCKYEVPASAYEQYVSATNWSAKASQIVASEEF